MSRGLIAYNAQQLSFILAMAMAALTGGALLFPRQAKPTKPILYYAEVFCPYVEFLSWVVDPDLTKSFWYFILSLSLPVNQTCLQLSQLYCPFSYFY